MRNRSLAKPLSMDNHVHATKTCTSKGSRNNPKRIRSADRKARTTGKPSTDGSCNLSGEESLEDSLDRDIASAKRHCAVALRHPSTSSFCGPETERCLGLFRTPFEAQVSWHEHSCPLPGVFQDRPFRATPLIVVNGPNRTVYCFTMFYAIIKIRAEVDIRRTFLEYRVLFKREGSDGKVRIVEQRAVPECGCGTLDVCCQP